MTAKYRIKGRRCNWTESGWIYDVYGPGSSKPVLFGGYPEWRHAVERVEQETAVPRDQRAIDDKAIGLFFELDSPRT